MLRWAKSAGYATDESAFRVKPPEVRVEKVRRYNPVEVAQLVAAAKAGPPSSKGRGPKDPKVLARIALRETLAVEVLSRLGLRAGELRALRVEWIRWDEQRLVVPHERAYSPKGGKSRSIPIESEVLQLMREVIGERADGRVFEPQRAGRPAKPGDEKRGTHYRGTGVDVDALMHRLSKRAGVELLAHDLRHHAISRWVELMTAGRYSLADVQQWAGHESIRTTELYLHTTGDRWRSHAQALEQAAAQNAQALGSALGSGDGAPQEQAASAVGSQVVTKSRVP